MRVLGITGWSGSGKTRLVTRLIPALTARGLVISTIKHAHHDFDVDTPGKDSYEHRAAGATEVLVSSVRRWALMHEVRGDAEPGLDGLLARMSPVDLVLVEGFKHEGHEKIEVRRTGNDRPPLYPNDDKVIAVASDHPLPDAAPPVLDLNDTTLIADFVVDHCGLGAPRT
jgi:molybdopterin-guanine dinucleotide biosynthesis protein B